MGEDVPGIGDRPTVADAVRQYDTLLESVRGALTRTGGATQWAATTQMSRSGCPAPYDHGDGQVVASPVWAGTPVPDEQWPAARAAVQELAVAQGFTVVEVIKDEPGDHVLSINGPYGAVLDIGTSRRTVVSYLTGCHPA